MVLLKQQDDQGFIFFSFRVSLSCHVLQRWTDGLFFPVVAVFPSLSLSYLAAFI